MRISDWGFIFAVLHSCDAGRVAAAATVGANKRMKRVDGTADPVDFRWMAPESYYDNVWDAASDVWMLGMTLWGA